MLSTEIPACTIQINLFAVRRVFDNLFINILKYADPEYPVDISFGLEEGFVSTTIRNRIKKDTTKEKSTNIGLATCDKIMSQHHGTLRRRRGRRILRHRAVPGGDPRGRG